MAMLRRQLVWHYDLTPEELWPVVSHTARVNEAAGFPSYELDETAQPDGGVDRHGSVTIAGITVGWEECPFEWVAERSFTQKRLFTSGPVRSGTIHFRLDPEEGGSRVSVELLVDTKNVLGVIAGKVLMARFAGTFDKLTRQAVEFLKGRRVKLYDYKPPKPGPQARRRAEAAVAALEKSPYAHGLAQKLSDFVFDEQDAIVGKIRPLALAELWDAPSRHTIELCLAAVDAGLLGMRWELLCPSCRGGKEAVTALDQLPSGAHCPSCNIDYARDFASNVELVFFPSALIRSVPEGGYCLSGPVTTPHVAIQQTLKPGEERRIGPGLPPGPWRARALTGTLSTEFEIGRDRRQPVISFADTEIDILPVGKDGGNDGAITLINRRDRETTFVIESRQWVSEALTAHRVTTLQAFRDLFRQAALRPGDEASVDQVTLLFSDLKGSTALYERVGDTAAYNLVREHFAYLTGIVREHNGALVKTIGDAVMAAFADPADAIAASIDIQEHIGEFNAGHRLAGEKKEAVFIKLGVHRGPCVVVTLNGQLDYFGSTANLAARLQGESRGGDLVISETVAEDPGVAPLISDLPLSREKAMLRGFAKPAPFCRISFNRARKAA